MKRRAVIEVLHMRDFVRDDRAAHEIGRHDQSPVHADRTIRRATAPAPLRAGERKARHRFTGTRAIVGQVLGAVRQCLGLEPALQARCQSFDGATDHQSSLGYCRFAPGACRPRDLECLASKRQYGIRRNCPRLGHPRQLAGQPVRPIPRKGFGIADPAPCRDRYPRFTAIGREPQRHASGMAELADHQRQFAAVHLDRAARDGAGDGRLLGPRVRPPQPVEHTPSHRNAQSSK